MNNKHKTKFVAFEYTSIVTVATTILRKNKIQLTLACKVIGTSLSSLLCEDGMCQCASRLFVSHRCQFMINHNLSLH